MKFINIFKIATVNPCLLIPKSGSSPTLHHSQLFLFMMGHIFCFFMLRNYFLLPAGNCAKGHCSNGSGQYSPLVKAHSLRQPGWAPRWAPLSPGPGIVDVGGGWVVGNDFAPLWHPRSDSSFLSMYVFPASGPETLLYGPTSPSCSVSLLHKSPAEENDQVIALRCCGSCWCRALENGAPSP